MLTVERLRELLDYDPETGVFLWKVCRGGAGKGSIAGFRMKDGYRRIRIGRRPHGAHRLAWLHVHGCWPVDEIDHINGDCDDNRLCNLRQATLQQNRWNRRRQKTNTSGFKGVGWDGRKWHARITKAGRLVQIGRFDAAEDAHAAYCAAAVEIHGEFARFD